MELVKASNSQFLLKPRGSLYGLTLGKVNHLSMNGFKKEFKMDNSKVGITRTKIRRVPSELKIKISDRLSWLALVPLSSQNEINIWINIYKKQLGSNALTCFMSNRQFLVFTKGEKNKNNLLTIYKAFMNKNISIGYPFFDDNFTFLIYNNVPNDLFKLIREKDKENQDLRDIVTNSKIEQRLKKAGIRLHTFVPAFNLNRTRIKYFIGAVEVEKYRNGWYTLSDLNDLIKGTGKAIK